MIDDDWTERDVREALRKSPEYETRGRESAEKAVGRIGHLCWRRVRGSRFS